MQQVHISPATTRTTRFFEWTTAVAGARNAGLKDVAKRQLAEAAKKVFELGRDVAPMIVNTAAYNFFKGMMGM
jgi:hypothetical protein